MVKILDKFGRREVQVLDATLSVHGRTKDGMGKTTG